MLARTGDVAASPSTSDPNGAYQFNLHGNSDTVISLPVARWKAASGLVASFSGNLITANGAPGWATGQFVYSLNDHYGEYSGGEGPVGLYENYFDWTKHKTALGVGGAVIVLGLMYLLIKKFKPKN